jgi:hypothetical protein
MLMKLFCIQEIASSSCPSSTASGLSSDRRLPHQDHPDRLFILAFINIINIIDVVS